VAESTGQVYMQSQSLSVSVVTSTITSISIWYQSDNGRPPTAAQTAVTINITACQLTIIAHHAVTDSNMYEINY